MVLFCYFGYNIILPGVALLFNLWSFKKNRSFQLGLQHLRPEYKTVLLVKGAPTLESIQDILKNYQPEYLLIEKQENLNEQRLTIQIKTNKTQFYLKTNIQVIENSAYIYIFTRSVGWKGGTTDAGYSHRVATHFMNYLDGHLPVVQLLK